MANKSFFGAIFKRPIIRWFGLTYFVIVVVTFFIYFVQRQIIDSRETLIESRYIFHKIRKENAMLHDRVKEMEKNFSSLQAVGKFTPDRLDLVLETINEIESKIKNESTSGAQISSLSVKVANLAKRTSELSEQLQKIRLALNPTKPEEILMVARLGDKFELFNQKVDVLEQKIEKYQQDINATVQSNFERINGELNRLLTFLGLFFAPLFIRMIRDYLGSRGGRTEQEQEDVTPQES